MVVPLPLIRLKPVPEIVACAMFTALEPVLVRLKLWTALVPTGTFPKVSVVALAERVPAPPGVALGCVDEALVTPAQLESATAASMTTSVASRLHHGPLNSVSD